MKQVFARSNRLFLLFLALGMFAALPQAPAQQEAQQEPAAAIEAAATAFVVPIRGEIDRSLVVFVRRQVQAAAAAGAGFIIFVIDTFGGRVDSALQIATLIGSVESAQTVAYVPSAAEGTGVSWSAGALIALSTSRIYMAPGTSMGAAAPVYQTAEGMQMAEEKVVSALRAQMAALAEKNGYPTGIALAMVDADVELQEMFLGGELRVVTADERPSLEREAGEQGLTLEPGRVISAGGKLLTLTAGQAERYGVSSGTMPGLPALLEHLEVSAGGATYTEQTAPDRLVALITGQAVTSLLVIIGLIALYMEITSPGFGVPGTVALISFATVFLSGALLGTVGSLELIVFLVGLALLLVEIFLIPGFGVTGITGIVAMAFALVFSRVDFVWPELEWQWDLLYRNLLWVGVSIIGSLFGIALLYRYLPSFAPFRRLMLSASQDTRLGYTVQEESIRHELFGRQGTALTTLRPAGRAEIDGEPVDVVTEGGFLPAGTPVRVIEVSGNRVVVRKV